MERSPNPARSFAQSPRADQRFKVTTTRAAASREPTEVSLPKQTSVRVSPLKRSLALAAVAVLLATPAPARQPQQQSARRPDTHGRRYSRLVVRNAVVIDGNGTPASGPFDIVVEGDTIRDIVPLDPVAVKSGTARRPAAARQRSTRRASTSCPASSTCTATSRRSEAACPSRSTTS